MNGALPPNSVLVDSYSRTKRITLYRLLYQPGQLGFGFVDIDCLHDKPH
jgi:hypothetical protein